MKIVHVNYSGSKGGAAIAAMRISHALNKYEIEVESEVWCAREPFDGACKCIKSRFLQKLDSAKAILLSRLVRRSEYSINVFPTRLAAQLNACNADVVHFHWINGEMISVSQLAKITKPLVWTFHDMWPFCSGEHYSIDERYVTGYQRSASSRQATGDSLSDEARSKLGEQAGRCNPGEAGRTESGNQQGEARGRMIGAQHPKPNARFDLDRWVFKRKQKHWKNLSLHIVCPSRWLAACSKNSLLLASQPTRVIPNCVDLDLFKPLENTDGLRKKYGLPCDRKIILFGAVDPHNTRKGGDLLMEALNGLSGKEEYALAIFGRKFDGLDSAGLQIIWLGSVSSAESMAEVYNCADVMCIPSRQDNLPNTGVEAQACGLPVVAFDVGGLSDIVDHLDSGYLANPFDPKDYLQGIEWVFAQGKGESNLSVKARAHALDAFAGSTIAEQYKSVYLAAINPVRNGPEALSST